MNDLSVVYNNLDDYWFIIERLELSEKCPDNQEAQLIDGSCANIEYELYPSEQGNIAPMSFIKMNGELINKCNNICLSKDYNLPNTDVNINLGALDNNNIFFRDMTLEIHDDGKYIIKKNGIFLSGFIDKNGCFQKGDGCVFVDIYKETNIIVSNYGDVSSKVIIKCRGDKG